MNKGSFELGASVFYRFGGCYENFGLIAGADVAFGKLSNVKDFKYQYWDIRGGFTLSKYFALGVIYGKYPTSISDGGEVLRCGDDWGGFGTFILPITKHVGLDIDFGYCVYSKFKCGIGVMVRFPLKHRDELD